MKLQMIPKLPGYIPSQNIDRTYFGITSQTKLDSFDPDKPKKTSFPVKFKELSELRRNFEEKENKWSTVSQNDFKDFYGLGLGQTTSDSHELFVLSMTQAVLKFSACFFENLAYSNLEKMRVRKVIIQFFIEDSSISAHLLQKLKEYSKIFLPHKFQYFFSSSLMLLLEIRIMLEKA